MSFDAPAGVTRPIVFLDIQIGETAAGRIKIELFSDVVERYVASCRSPMPGQAEREELDADV
jgi:peptidyl-prolyl isomerase H (cyclophilin H)